MSDERANSLVVIGGMKEAINPEIQFPMALFVQDLNYLQTRSGKHSSSGARGMFGPVAGLRSR